MFAAVLASLLPVMLMILLGAALRAMHFLPEACFHGLNKLAFWVGLPCMLFLDIAGASASGAVTLRIAAAILGGSLLAGLCAWAVAALWHLPQPTLRAFVQGAFRGNLAYVGIPVVYFALDADPEARAVAVLALAPTIPLFNVACVLVLLKPGEGHWAQRLGKTLLEIARNPLIIACLLGLLARHLALPLPDALMSTVRGVGGLGLPCALFALGASLTPERVRGQGRPACGAAFFKVVISPLIGYTLGRALGLDGDRLLIAVLFAATPTAVASFVMADQMGADRNLAAAIIVVSTLLAFPALAVVMLLMR
jgi:predicted permease